MWDIYGVSPAWRSHPIDGVLTTLKRFLGGTVEMRTLMMHSVWQGQYTWWTLNASSVSARDQSRPGSPLPTFKCTFRIYKNNHVHVEGESLGTRLHIEHRALARLIILFSLSWYLVGISVLLLPHEFGSCLGFLENVLCLILVGKTKMVCQVSITIKHLQVKKLN